MRSHLIVPDGQAKGCLPRKTRYGDICYPLSDRIETIDRSEWAGLIGAVELRPYVKKIFNQGRNGSCASEGTHQGCAIIRAWQGLKFVEFNPLAAYGRLNGGRDNGSSIDENLQWVRDYGMLPESYWPRSKGWKASLPDGWKDVAKQYRVAEFFDIGTITEVGTALLKGFPVVFGWQGHCCVMTTLLDDRTALYANSWATTWGDKGFGKIRLNDVNFGYGAFAVRSMVSQAG